MDAKVKLKKLLAGSEKKLKYYYQCVEKINDWETQVASLSDEQLREKTTSFKQRLANGETLNDIKEEAFAVVREAAKRTIGLRHFDVQLIGGLVLNEGNIAEMATGEGKTLVASLPSYLRALEGKGVHVITVNEYLAKRDSELIGEIHRFLGLTVGLNLSGLTTSEKQAAYQADITYGVGNEFGFDYLRDNMVYDVRQRVQRPFYYAIIDEVDSVLIDEAKTPLIIAGKAKVSANLHYICARVVKRFVQDKDYYFDPETKAVHLSDEGINKTEKAFGIDNLFDLKHQVLYHYMIQALRAHVMLKKDVDYIVKDGKIELVDLFTGRIMEGRSYSDGLHQALEAKEGLEITEENKMQATITVQNYFRMYPILSGMTGTAKTEEKEFQQVYGMDVVEVPTNKPKIRIDMPDQVYKTAELKFQAVAKEVEQCHKKGQPVLVGTTSIEKSELVASYFDKQGLPYQLLNAKSAEQEAKLIAKAGQKGQITIATNMAGRGTDIMLGEGVAELGGLYVIGTERHESRRIDNQLRGRAGRQGDPGVSRFFVSLEDDIVVRFAGTEVQKMQALDSDENGKINDKRAIKFFEKVQRICEGNNFSIREFTLKLDDAVNEQRNIIYQLRKKVIKSQDILPIIEPMIRESIAENIVEYTPEERVPEDWKLSSLADECNRMIAGEKIELTGVFESREEVETYIYRMFDTYIDLLKEMLVKKDMLTSLKRFLLSHIDRKWTEQLEAMTRLKEGIGLRGYGQEDPMRIYHREGFELFSATYRELRRLISIQIANMVKSILLGDEKGAI